MFAMKTTRVVIALCAAYVVSGTAVKETPLAKVVTLLKDLSKKIAAEGQREAAEYDKFACFCKEQADEKLYAMERSLDRVKHLSTQIEKLNDDLAQLDSDIVKAHDTVYEKKTKSDERKQKRAETHEWYLKRAQDMNEAIASCKLAIKTIKESKTEMRGAKLDLVQVTAPVVHAIKQNKELSISPSAFALLDKLDDEGAPKYQFHSNDIIATLEDLLATFNEMKKQLDIDEFNRKVVDDKVILGLLNETRYAEAEAREKEVIAESKDEARADALEQRQDEQQDHDSDQKFTKRLEEKCSEKAQSFDQRSGVRANELTALAKATEELEKGAVPNYEGNKMMAVLQTHAEGKKKFSTQKSEGGVKLSSPATFVQINQVQHRSEGALARVQSFLAEASESHQSEALAAIADRVQVAASRSGSGEDHFVLVRSLIKSLLSKLKADASSEAEQRGNCDRGIREATNKRDKAKAAIEVATAKHTVLVANKATLEDDNVALVEQIAELKKSLVESAELTAANLKDLQETEIMCRDGLESVKQAMAILQSFYSKAAPSFLQFVPRDADRFGKSVKELAPETEDDTYHGAQSESEGIIDILEVILSDFQRSLKKSQAEQEEAEAMQAEFEKQAEEDIEKKGHTIEKNDAKLTEVKADILDEEQALEDENALLQSAMASLEDYHTMCVKGEETYEERKKKREDEIAALKEAIDILDNWQN